MRQQYIAEPAATKEEARPRLLDVVNKSHTGTFILRRSGRTGQCVAPVVTRGRTMVAETRTKYTARICGDCIVDDRGQDSACCRHMRGRNT
jgi:hypothetical protein